MLTFARRCCENVSLDFLADQRRTPRQCIDRYHWDLYPDKEQHVKSIFLPAFAALGQVEEEVLGACRFVFDGQETVKRLRIDAVVELHQSVDKYQSCLGIEFKGGCMRTAEIGSYLSQCIDYRQTYWKGYGYLPVIACPGFAELICEKIDKNSRSPSLEQAHGESLGYMLKRVVAAFGIGEAFFAGPRHLYPAERLRISFADACWLRNGQRTDYVRKQFGRNQGSK